MQRFVVHVVSTQETSRHPSRVIVTFTPPLAPFVAVFVAVIAVIVIIADRWIEAFRAEFDAEGNGREFKWDILF